jgi:hypothetical protein
MLHMSEASATHRLVLLIGDNAYDSDLLIFREPVRLDQRPIPIELIVCVFKVGEHVSDEVELRSALYASSIEVSNQKRTYAAQQ